jgi:hypothetical protein
MSKFYTIVPLLLLSFLLNAQIKKKSILLGGQLFYYNDKYQIDNFDQKVESGTIGISLGKAFKENSVVGINLSYSPLKETNFLSGNDTVITRYNGFNIGGFFREYKKLAKDFYFFGQIDGAFITSNQKDDYKISAGDTKTTQRGGFISLTPGISYQVFKKMQIELIIPNILSIRYQITKFDSENPQVKSSKREQILFYSNLNNSTSLGWLGVGFRFIF